MEKTRLGRHVCLTSRVLETEYMGSEHGVEFFYIHFSQMGTRSQFHVPGILGTQIL